MTFLQEILDLENYINNEVQPIVFNTLIKLLTKVMNEKKKAIIDELIINKTCVINITIDFEEDSLVCDGFWEHFKIENKKNIEHYRHIKNIITRNSGIVFIMSFLKNYFTGTNIKFVRCDDRCDDISMTYRINIQ